MSAKTPKKDTTPESRFKVSADDLRGYPWQEAVAKSSRPECYSYNSAFAAKCREFEAQSDKKGERVYALLSVVASFHANYEAAGNPYRSMWIGSDGKRSLDAEDLVDEDLDALAGIVAEIADCEFRARVADVLWVTRRDYKAALVAINSFLESALRLKTDDLWPPFTERLERAAQLSAPRGFEKQSEVVVAAIEGYLHEFSSNDASGLLCDRLLSILLRSGAGDPAVYSKLAEAKARTFATLGNWSFSEFYWVQAAAWQRKAKDEAGVKRSMLEAAECSISRAEAGLKGTGTDFGYRAHWMGRGLEALRQGGAEPARVAAVHRKFLDLQKSALTEMTPVNIDLDAIPGFRESEEKAKAASIAHVAGYPWERALVRFIHLVPLTDTAAVKAEVIKLSATTLHDKIAATTAVDRSGKVADILGTTLEVDPTGEDLRKRMVHHVAQFRWPTVTDWNLEPARIQLCQDHAIRRQSLRLLTGHNPLVPQGHEGIWSRGLLAGFAGDWLVAMHLLLPQIEASIRHVFQQHGVITSGLDSDGTQKEKDLNQLLWMPEMEQIFGPDVSFDLRGILVERFGLNLRNESAHGLMPEGAFYHPGAVYLWWLMMRLLWWGYRSAHSTQVVADEV